MISIVIPSYNRLPSLKKCIDSIISQISPEIEIIVIDDFSSDGTLEFLREMKMKYEYLKVIENKENLGVNYSRNRGIEAASKKYVFFLDSDDGLNDGCLQKVIDVLKINQEVKHFLFLVSDRSEEFKSLPHEKRVDYKEWIQGTITGDFSHIVSAEIIKKFPFHEEFRMFEYLNWIRVKKETSPQLLVPIVLANRERNRTDSLIKTATLNNTAAIIAKFRSNKLYYSLYHNDLKALNPGALGFPLLKTIILGSASGEKRDAMRLLHFSNTLSIKIIGIIALLIPAPVVNYGITRYSNYKRKKWLYP